MRAVSFDIGRRVLYIPTHANGDREHADVERGIVTSTNPSTVFVRFDGESNSKGCYPENLVYEL